MCSCRTLLVLNTSLVQLTWFLLVDRNGTQDILSDLRMSVDPEFRKDFGTRSRFDRLRRCILLTSINFVQEREGCWAIHTSGTSPTWEQGICDVSIWARLSAILDDVRYNFVVILQAHHIINKCLTNPRVLACFQQYSIWQTCSTNTNIYETLLKRIHVE